MHISFHSGTPILTTNCHSRPLLTIVSRKFYFILRLPTFPSLSLRTAPEVVFSNQTVNEQKTTLGLTSFTHFVSHYFDNMGILISRFVFTLNHVECWVQNKIGRFSVASGRRLAFNSAPFTMPSLYWILHIFGVGFLSLRWWAEALSKAKGKRRGNLGNPCSLSFPRKRESSVPSCHSERSVGISLNLHYCHSGAKRRISEWGRAFDWACLLVILLALSAPVML